MCNTKIDPVVEELARLSAVHDRIEQHLHTMDNILARVRADIDSMKRTDNDLRRSVRVHGTVDYCPSCGQESCLNH